MKGSATADVELILGSKQLIDYTSTANVIYYGLSAPGSSQTDAVWQIRRETDDSQGRLIQMEFANGSIAFNQAWSSRTALSYS